jgi:signal transduction histidine kinase
VNKLLAHQIRTCTGPDGGFDTEAFVATVARTYDEVDRERRLNDRANRLMEEELLAANERIREHGEQKLIETLESAPAAIALLRADLTVQAVNTAMTSLCDGLSEPPAQGEHFVTFLSRIGQSDLTVIDELLRGAPVEVQFGERWYLAATRALSDGSHSVAFSEITALRQREEILAMAKDAAESASKLKSQFLAVMSHELRTPLNAILGFSEVIRDRVFGGGEKMLDRYCDYAKSIHESGEHLLELISEVLDLSKIESGSYTLYIESVNIAAVLRSSLELVRPQASVRNLKLHYDETQWDCVIDADARALKQVVVNLLSNAVKFTPPDGQVSLQVVRNENEIVLSVSDTGIGIAPEHQKAVFEAFHQGEARLARTHEGTGLGLSISKGLIEMHGGTITLQSEEGVGTCLTVRLPHKATYSVKAEAA